MGRGWPCCEFRVVHHSRFHPVGLYCKDVFLAGFPKHAIPDTPGFVVQRGRILQAKVQHVADIASASSLVSPSDTQPTRAGPVAVQHPSGNPSSAGYCFSMISYRAVVTLTPSCLRRRLSPSQREDPPELPPLPDHQELRRDEN